MINKRKKLSFKMQMFGLMAMALSIGMVGCSSDDAGSGVSTDTKSVTLALQTIDTGAKSNGEAPSHLPAPIDGTAIIEGTNGSLYLTEVHFILDDIELENELDDSNDVDYNEFEDGLFFVNLALDGAPLEIATSPIPAGTYNSLDFEIDDLDIDEDEDVNEQQEKEALLTQIQATFPNWPETASMVIVGTFISNDGVESTFTTYADAEVDIENDLNPALEIGDDAPVNQTLSVSLNLENWFLLSDGSVMDLSEYDYASTGTLLEFEVEMENGFTDVEIDD